MRNISRNKRRSLSTLGLLASASFLILSIGVFRLDANRDATKRESGAGGFAFIGQSALPIVHDLNSPAGREFYSLPSEATQEVRVVPFRVREGDDASCLNLNRAQQPRLLGVNPAELEKRGAFKFAKTLGNAKASWALLRGGEADIVPGIADAASIQWALGKKLGDVISYKDEKGRTFQVKLVAALANSILQGNILIAEENFITRFPSEPGYRMFLIDAPSKSASQISEAWTRAFRDLGLELTPAAERLAQFNAVQNTYLSTFQSLGGLGLILGSLGLGVVVLRNVLERRGELALLLAVGFERNRVARLVLSEHALLLGLGLGLGMLAAAAAVLPAWLRSAQDIPYLSLGLTLAGAAGAGLFCAWAGTRLALRGRLLDALRNE